MRPERHLVAVGDHFPLRIEEVVITSTKIATETAEQGLGEGV